MRSLRESCNSWPRALSGRFLVVFGLWILYCAFSTCSVVHFLVLYSTCFLFFPRAFSSVFSCPSSTFAFDVFLSPSLSVDFVTRAFFHFALWVSHAFNVLWHRAISTHILECLECLSLSPDCNCRASHQAYKEGWRRTKRIRGSEPLNTPESIKK